ncbi:hypothetical protein GM415_10435 [Pseudodesulfovibrio cashew]|uniref:Periplasmic heavy metal sensor n=1 Tax=Pseudodesulfovibrio cashew TaxID=2678688 RepID=A0A6I6JSI6_9BACT|nr:hypothetical protein [Pseudodesulfovibrio cashew]QGY40524.1 hypothetical protein GM415_10435 [Pseudodesulfovibrio cashew]
MSKWRVWTAFLTVFVCGVLVGVTGLGLFLRQHFRPPEDPSAFRKEMRERVLTDLREEVRPSPGAMAAIAEIVDATQDELEAIREETFPRVEAAFAKGKERISEHLTPEQRKRFEVLLEKRHKGEMGLFRLPPPMPPRPGMP